MPSVTAVGTVGDQSEESTPAVAWLDTGGATADAADIVAALGTTNPDETDTGGYLSCTPELTGAAANAFTYRLRVNGFDWDTPIPSDATNIYAVVSLKHKLSGATIFNWSLSLVQFVDVGTTLPIGDDLSADRTVTSTTYVTETFGDAGSDAFNASLTPAIVNDTDFALAFDYTTDQDSDFGTLRAIRVTYAAVTLHWTDGNGTRRRSVSVW